jgi:hypothetical protein
MECSVDRVVEGGADNRLIVYGDDKDRADADRETRSRDGKQARLTFGDQIGESV